MIVSDRSNSLILRLMLVFRVSYLKKYTIMFFFLLFSCVNIHSVSVLFPFSLLLPGCFVFFFLCLSHFNCCCCCLSGCFLWKFSSNVWNFPPPNIFKRICFTKYGSSVFALLQFTASKRLLKKILWHRCFPVNFSKFLRTPFLQNTSGRLLLQNTTSVLPIYCIWT